MKIVIDIPEEEYTRIMSMDHFKRTYEQDMIYDGVPLPKGHGDLIDKEELLSAVTTIFGQDAIHSGLWNVICNQPTIIEAESEDKE